MIPRVRIGSFTIVLSLLLASPATSDDWTVGVGGKPGRYSQSSEIGPDTSRILWQGGLSAVIAQQAVIEANILAMARIQDINDVLHGTRIVVHNLINGDTLWTADLPVDFPSSDWRNRVSALRDGNVYATRAGNTNQSYLYALNAQTGAIVWQSQGLINETSTEGVSFAQNGDLIVGNFSSIVRIRTSDGTTAWSLSRTCPASDGCAAAVVGNKAYIWEASGQGPIITAFNIETGTRLYSSIAVAGGLVQQVSPFAGPDGTVYAPRTQNNPATDFLVALSDNGSALVEKWRVPLGYVPFASFGVGPDSSVYSYSRSFRVIRLDHTNGTMTDSSEVITSDFYQPRMAIDAMGRIYLTNGGFSQGRVYSFNANLTLRWSEPIANVNVGGPAIGRGGILIVCGVGTDVRAYSTAPLHVSESLTPPRLARLYQNYPNPFNPATRIRYSVPKQEFVTLKVFNTLGQEVKALVNEIHEPGTYEAVLDVTGLASGVYFYRLSAGEFSETKKLLLMK